MDFKSAGFVFEDGIVQIERKPPLGSGIPITEVLLGLDLNP